MSVTVFCDTFARWPGDGTQAGSPLACTVTENALLCATRYTCGQAMNALLKMIWS